MTPFTSVEDETTAIMILIGFVVAVMGVWLIRWQQFREEKRLADEAFAEDQRRADQRSKILEDPDEKPANLH